MRMRKGKKGGDIRREDHSNWTECTGRESHSPRPSSPPPRDSSRAPPPHTSEPLSVPFVPFDFESESVSVKKAAVCASKRSRVGESRVGERILHAPPRHVENACGRIY